jgi:hypothetical protein
MVVSGVGERISLFVDVDSVEVESYGLLLQDFLRLIRMFLAKRVEP